MENIFVKYNFENSSYLNWETSFGIEQKDEVYKKLLKNSEVQEIKEISKDEILAMEYRNIGKSFNENKEYKKAIEYFEKVATLNSEDFKSYKYQGDSWLGLNNFNKAVENYAYVEIAKNVGGLVLGLTASPGAKKQKIKKILENLKIKNIESRVRDDSDVKEHVKEIQIDWVKVQMDENLKKIQESISDTI